MWIQKYKPKKLEEILGNSTLIKSLKNYEWKKPILLYGPPGVGKSLLVELLAKELNFEVMEVKDENLDNLAVISESQSLFCRKKLIFFDQIENISEIKKVTDFLKERKIATILTTTDFKSKRLATIKKICEKVQMRRTQATTISNFLLKICETEKIKVNKEILTKIAENSQGDIRAAIVDLETIAKGKSEINEKDLEILESRDKVSDIYNVLSLILVKKGMNINEIIESTYSIDEKPENVLLWIDENLPKIFYGKENLEKAYGQLSKADIFLGRIMNRQYWGFLRYANSLMTAGVNVSKGEKVNFSRYQYPFYIIKMAQTKKERALKKEISRKLSSAMHASTKIITKEYLPLFKILLKHKKVNEQELSENFKFTEEEIEFLKE